MVFLNSNDVIQRHFNRKCFFFFFKCLSPLGVLFVRCVIQSNRVLEISPVVILIFCSSSKSTSTLSSSEYRVTINLQVSLLTARCISVSSLFTTTDQHTERITRDAAKRIRYPPVNLKIRSSLTPEQDLHLGQERTIQHTK